MQRPGPRWGQHTTLCLSSHLTRVSRHPGAAWQLLEPSTTASYADQEGESQGRWKEQLCAPLFAGPGADGQHKLKLEYVDTKIHWLPTALEIKLGKTGSFPSARQHGDEWAISFPLARALPVWLHWVSRLGPFCYGLWESHWKYRQHSTSLLPPSLNA